MVHKQLISIFSILYRADANNSYGNALICQWIKAFGEPHVITKKSVKLKLEKLVENYYSHVYL